MEALTRLVTESLARHGFDRPLDYRRLTWSRWFRCESHHSLLFVPSQPGVFAVAEEVMDLTSSNAHVATDASPVPRSEASGPQVSLAPPPISGLRAPEAESRKPEARSRRLLAVTQFFEDDDMAFVLDRMLSRENPMRARLVSGRYFVRFVVVEDQIQRRSICNALNQWMANSAEKATGIGSHFASSLELTPATEYVPQPDDRQQNLFAEEASVARAPSPASASSTNAYAESNAHVGTDAFVRPASEASASTTNPAFSAPTFATTSPHLDSGAATNIHCPSPLPSGF
jgi:hypothetical protein